MAQQHNYYHNAESMAESAPVRCFFKIHAWSIIHGGPFVFLWVWVGCFLCRCPRFFLFLPCQALVLSLVFGLGFLVFPLLLLRVPLPACRPLEEGARHSWVGGARSFWVRVLSFVCISLSFLAVFLAAGGARTSSSG